MRTSVDRQDTNYKDLTEKVVLKEGETYVWPLSEVVITCW
jgi:hypothetical protein